MTQFGGPLVSSSEIVTVVTKDWLTARQIAELKLPGVPQSERGVQIWLRQRRADGEYVQTRKRHGVGGGSEYHYSSMPVAAVAAYVNAVFDITRIPDQELIAEVMRRFPRGFNVNAAL